MTPSQTSELNAFRIAFHRCLTGWGDALFELGDAVLCSPTPVASVPSLSLEPIFRRSHGSLYKALALGEIDEDRLRRLLVANRPTRWPLIFAVDASTWDRCDAECSPERGFYYSASKHSAGQPIVAGWSYQWICQLDFAPDSWTAPLDAMRIPPTTNTTNATIDQVRRLVSLLPDNQNVPMFVFDAGYDPIAIGHELASTRVQVLCRIRDDRVFHADPPPRPNRPPGTGGRPPRHGATFKCSDPTTWPEPSARLDTSDRRYGTVTVQAWPGLHPRLSRRGHWTSYDTPPIVKGSVIRVEVEHLPKPTARTNKTLLSAAVAVVDRTRHPRPRRVLARLPATLRHRTHLPFRQEHPRLDHPITLHTRTSRPLDLAHRRRPHPTPPRPQSRRRPPAPMGTTPPPTPTHPGTSAQRVSPTWRHNRHPSQPTETLTGRTRPPQRHPQTPKNPPPRHQKSSLNQRSGLIAS